MEKKIDVITNIIITVILFIFVALVLFMVSCVESRYSTKGEIVWIENSVATIEDQAGNLWEWEIENEDLKIYDNVKLYMDNNGTERDNTDDVILKISVDKRKG